MSATAPMLPYISITRAGTRAIGGNVMMFPRGLFVAGVPRFLIVTGGWPVIRIVFTDAVNGTARRLTWRGSHWQASLPVMTLEFPLNLEIFSRDSRPACRQLSAYDYVFDFSGRDGLADAAIREGKALLDRLDTLNREHPGLKRMLGVRDLRDS